MNILPPKERLMNYVKNHRDSNNNMGYSLRAIEKIYKYDPITHEDSHLADFSLLLADIVTDHSLYFVWRNSCLKLWVEIMLAYLDFTLSITSSVKNREYFILMNIFITKDIKGYLLFIEKYVSPKDAKTKDNLYEIAKLYFNDKELSKLKLLE